MTPLNTKANSAEPTWRRRLASAGPVNSVIWLRIDSSAFAGARSASPTTCGVDATTAGRYAALKAPATNVITAASTTGASVATTTTSGTMSSARAPRRGPP